MKRNSSLLCLFLLTSPFLFGDRVVPFAFGGGNWGPGGTTFTWCELTIENPSGQTQTVAATFNYVQFGTAINTGPQGVIMDNGTCAASSVSGNTVTAILTSTCKRMLIRGAMNLGNPPYCQGTISIRQSAGYLIASASILTSANGIFTTVLYPIKGGAAF